MGVDTSVRNPDTVQRHGPPTWLALAGWIGLADPVIDALGGAASLE